MCHSQNTLILYLFLIKTPKSHHLFVTFLTVEWEKTGK